MSIFDSYVGSFKYMGSESFGWNGITDFYYYDSQGELSQICIYSYGENSVIQFDSNIVFMYIDGWEYGFYDLFGDESFLDMPLIEVFLMPGCYVRRVT